MNTKLQNKQGITRFKMTRNAKFHCSLGNDWCIAEIKIEMLLGAFIPDYCEMDGVVRCFDGFNGIAEDIVGGVFSACKEYEPFGVRVSALVYDGTNPSAPVEISKEENI